MLRVLGSWPRAFANQARLVPHPSQATGGWLVSGVATRLRLKGVHAMAATGLKTGCLGRLLCATS